MFSKIRSLGLGGIQGYEVSVECSISSGLPGFEIVGLPDAAVREARERVRAAVKNSEMKFPVSRITVNLAPAGTKKAGTVYDLPMMLGILAASGAIEEPPSDCAFIGELSLAGAIRPVSGALPMAFAAARAGIKNLFVPRENGIEASLAGSVSIYPVESVRELMEHLTGEKKILPVKAPEIKPEREKGLDYSQVKAQENVKRALEVAAAGGHNILLVGPPGAGKSMLAKRLPTILPDMSRREIIESTEIHSVAGLTGGKMPVVSSRPFRAPHHTVSATAMSGGTAVPRPGEVSLAHNGVLFLDEMPEFHKDVLEALRQPLEDGRVTVSRASGTVTYPSRFMLVCAMNPCRCGWYGHPSGRCTCTPADVKRYQSKISGPLMDRIDIYVEVPALNYGELRERGGAETSEEIKKRVDSARSIQASRFGGGSGCNAHMDTEEISRYCALSDACERLMQGAYEKMGLTARSYDRILRVSRTIADLDGAEDIRPEHIAEAIQYRTYDFRGEM